MRFPSVALIVALLLASPLAVIGGDAAFAQNEIFSGNGNQRGGDAAAGAGGDERFAGRDRCDWQGYERANRETGVEGSFVYSDRWIDPRWWHPRRPSPSSWCDGRLVVWIDPAYKRDFDKAKRCDTPPGVRSPCEEEFAGIGIAATTDAAGDEIFSASEPPPAPPRGWQPVPKDPRVFSSCDPYYGGRKAFIQDLLYRTGCQLRAGEVFWCRQAKPNMGNLSLSPRPDMPFVPSGVRMKPGECDTEAAPRGDEFAGDGGGYGTPNPRPSLGSCQEKYRMSWQQYAAALLRNKYCTMNGDGDIWCQQRNPYSLSLELATAKEYDLVPTGLRLTRDCELLKVARPYVEPPPPKGGTREYPPEKTQPGIERVCGLQHLAAVLYRNYYTEFPVARVKVANGIAPNTYLVTLSGMQPRLGASTNMADALIALTNIKALDSYRTAIIEAVQDLPKGSTLILAGHSQGGMEAMNVAENLVHRWGFKVAQIITYGAPVTADKVKGVAYYHVREKRDPVPALDRKYDLTDVHTVDAPGASQNLADAVNVHTAYHLPLMNYGPNGDFLPATLRRTLKSQCFELQVDTVRRYLTPNLFTRIVDGDRDDNPKRDGRRTPRNPDKGTTNCFWVSLAQDRFWGEKIPYTAACERAPTDEEEIERVLARQYGGKPISDLHGIDKPEEGFQRHAMGIPVPSSRAQIEAALKAAGPGSRGLIFVKMAPGMDGHAFNVRLRANDGTIEYWDGQGGFKGDFWLNPLVENHKVYFYRTQ
jgi:hypothetical protein